jgi:hypothetical protein
MIQSWKEKRAVTDNQFQKECLTVTKCPYLHAIPNLWSSQTVSVFGSFWKTSVLENLKQTNSMITSAVPCILHTERMCAGPTCKWVLIVTGVCWRCVSPLLGAPLGLSCHTRVCSLTSRGLKECHHEWLPTSVQSLWAHNSNVFWKDLMSYATKQIMCVMPRKPQLKYYLGEICRNMWIEAWLKWLTGVQW